MWFELFFLQFNGSVLSVVLFVFCASFFGHGFVYVLTHDYVASDIFKFLYILRFIKLDKILLYNEINKTCLFTQIFRNNRNYPLPKVRS